MQVHDCLAGTLANIDADVVAVGPEARIEQCLAGVDQVPETVRCQAFVRFIAS